MTKRMTALLAIALVALVAGRPAAGDEGKKRVRVAHPIHSADAKGLAETLTKHFRGEGEVQILADPTGAFLLINAPEKMASEVVRLLDQLDRRPRALALEVIVAEVTAKDAAKLEPDLSGSAADVYKRLEALRKKGTLGELRRIQIATLENQPTSVRLGEAKPITSAASEGRFGGKGPGKAGPVSRSIFYRDVGTTLAAMARSAGEKEVVVDLDLSDSSLRVAPDAPVLGQDENGGPIKATSVTMTTLKTRLRVPTGRVVLAKGVDTQSSSGKGQTWVLVSARLVDPAAK